MDGKRPRHRTAFTLVEILAVIIILGIISAIILPQLGSRDDLRAAAGARLLMADLIYAQNMAISQQRMHFVKFDVPGKRYSILNSVSPDEVVIQHPISKDDFVVVFESTASGLRDVILEFADFDGQTVLAFDELGTPHHYDGSSVLPLSVGSVVLRSGSHTLTVSIEPFTGEINVK